MMCPTFPRSNRGTAAALVTLSLTAALLVAPARAAEPGDDTSDGWKKVLSFAHCAVNVFRAVTPTDWTIAFLDCSRLFMEEPPLPGSGGQP
jgi:hypothetical protein